MPSFIDVDTSDAQEPYAVKDGEYKVRCTGFIKKTLETDDGEAEVIIWNNSNDEPCFMPIFEVVGHPMAKEFNHYVPVPHAGLDKKALEQAKWRIEELKRAFGVKAGAKFDVESLEGKEAWAFLVKKEEGEYGEQNRIRKFILPGARKK
jgi:hypothetical protein